MITATAAPRPSLPAALNPAQRRPSSHPQHPANLSVTGPVGATQRENQSLCNSLQLIAKRLPLFSSTYSLFFAKQGVGYTQHDNFFSTLNETVPKREKPRTAWGEAIRGLGG
jgi:hypothetical protein